MTIEISGNRISYAGNGVTLAFSFPYPFVEKTDLLVIIVNDTTSVESVQTYTTDYSVTGEGTIDSGQVTMVTAPATGETLVLVRAQEYTQPSELPENDPLPSATIEQQLDRNTIMSLQLLDLVSRSLKLSDGDTSGANLTLPVLAASKLLQVRSDGLGFQFANAADLSLSTVSAYIDTLLDDPDSMTARGTLELGGKWNLTATTNPGTGDDSDDNYGVGSVWVNVSANLAWLCFDATIGAAVWKQIDLPLTTQGDLLIRGASILERLAIGATQSTLRVVGGVPAWVSGDWEIIETLDAGGEAFQTFTADLSPYRRLWLDADNVLLNTSSDWPLVQVSQASSFLTTGYASHIHVSGSSSTAYSGGISVTNGWPMTGTAHATRKLGFDLHIHRPNDANEPLARWLSSHHSPSGLARVGVGGGNHTTAAVVDGLRVTSTSTITTGKFILKGIR